MFTGVLSKKVDLNYSIGTIEEKIPLFYGAKKNTINSAFVIKQSYFYYSMTATIRLVKFKEYNKVFISYTFRPSFWSWMLGLCCFPFGFLIFIFTSNAKNDFEQIFHNIEWE